MSFDLYSFRFLFLSGAFWLLVVPFLSKSRNSSRATISVFTFSVGAMYLAWRLLYTVLPFSGGEVQTAWVYTVYVVEIMSFVEIGVFLLIMSRINTRSAQADGYEKKLEGMALPSVDVFIPTYNEDLEVLEKTVVGALHLDYPAFKVWVLDDGRREWLRDFCGRVGAGYLTRPDNNDAKAGNMNNGLKHTSGDLFAIFDADFIPARNFLRRTVGFFIFNDDVGLVQTPQHFFNRDPIQTNLYLEKLWPDEQRLFFDMMAPCRDAWGAAFCCGSCSIARREAVEQIGGIPTSSITEDLLTTLCLLGKGYRTVYLNEKLSQGMSADSLKGYFIQRSRWCRGGIQCFFVPEGPLRAKGLSFLQRILFSPYGWVAQPVTRLFLLIVPVLYLWTGLQPLRLTSTGDLMAYQFPMLLSYALAMQWLAPKRYIPFISTSIGVFGMFRLLPVVVSSLIKPFGEPFRVTPKGRASATGVDLYTLTICSILLLATGGGIYLNLIPEHRTLDTMEFFPYALMWSALNMVILILCCLMCFDAPRMRREERFELMEPCVVGGDTEVEIEDMSLGGCRLRHSLGRRLRERGDEVSIAIRDLPSPLKAEVKNSSGTHMMCEFKDVSDDQREAMIAKLFTGMYDNEIYEATSFGRVILQVFRRALGKEKQ